MKRYLSPVILPVLCVLLSCGRPGENGETGSADTLVTEDASEESPINWEDFSEERAEEIKGEKATVGMEAVDVVSEVGMPVQRTVLANDEEEWIYKDRILRLKNGKVVSVDPR